MSRKEKAFIAGLILAIFLGIAGMLLLPIQVQDDREQERVRIAAIMIDPEVPFWNDAWRGARDAAEEWGVALSEYPYDQHSTDISELVETAVLANVDGILLRSQDVPSEALSRQLERAREAGIHIVTMDVDVAAEHRNAFMGIDNVAAAQALAKEAVRLLEEGESAVIVKTPDSAMAYTARVRIQAFKEAFLQEMPSDALQICELPEEEGLRTWALERFLQQQQDVGLLIGCAAKLTLSSLHTVSRSDQWKNIRIMGFCENEEALEAVENGRIQCLVRQDPYAMGKIGLQSLVELCGQGEEKRGDYLVPFQMVFAERPSEE